MVTMAAVMVVTMVLARSCDASHLNSPLCYTSLLFSREFHMLRSSVVTLNMNTAAVTQNTVIL